MKTKTITTYSINELSDHAQERAYYKWLEHWNNPWAGENEETLKAFERLFPVKIRDWSYGGRGEGVSFDMTCDDNVEELSGLRLAKYIWNNYGDKLYKPKYYGTTIPHAVDKDHPAGLEHVKRYSGAQRERSCVLTGYYMDDTILDPVYQFLDHPRENVTFRELMEECFDAWVKTCAEDAEANSSMEAFKEDAEANEWEFDENGRMI